ncbi:hypothetical protein GGI12_004984 [Dipsacomyces acuminosporus]|nr:hypothetical protein GGI12_004984 [Dipsacomyces acuminosporus]
MDEGYLNYDIGDCSYYLVKTAQCSRWVEIEEKVTSECDDYHTLEVSDSLDEVLAEFNIGIVFIVDTKTETTNTLAVISRMVFEGGIFQELRFRCKVDRAWAVAGDEEEDMFDSLRRGLYMKES